MKDLKGIYAALLTPFNDDGSINFDSITKLVEFNIAQGLHGLYVCGSTGESPLMSEEERIAILRHVAKVVNGRIKLIAHVGTISTDSAVRMAKVAEQCAYDAVSAVVPFYFSFSAEAIKGYYKDIIAATSLPMVIYNFPGSSGFNGMLDMVNELIDEPKLVGVKHTSVNLFDLERFKNLKKPLVVFNGFDEMLIGGLSMGADGGIGSTYNFMGKIILDIYNAFNKGDMAAAQEAQNKANRIIDAMIPYGVFAMEKAILTELGIPMGNCRKPFTPLSQEGWEVAKKIAKELK